MSIEFSVYRKLEESEYMPVNADSACYATAGVDDVKMGYQAVHELFTCQSKAIESAIRAHKA